VIGTLQGIDPITSEVKSSLGGARPTFELTGKPKEPFTMRPAMGSTGRWGPGRHPEAGVERRRFRPPGAITGFLKQTDGSRRESHWP
jgi:hypothetical protein